MPGLGDVVKGRRNSAQGGRVEESVANFALEAWEAHLAWRLYESVRKDTVHGASVLEFMSPFDHGERMPHADDRGELVIARDPWV
jgi:hypothetical protein